MSIMPLDELVTVEISEDKLSAFIKVERYIEPFPYTAEDLTQFLRQHNVCYGIREEVLADISANPRSYVQTRTVVAVGEPPTAGNDGEIRFLYEEGNLEKRPSELEDGTVDYKQLIKLSNVRKGQRIAERIPATEGSPGVSVTGEHIPGKPGKEARFKIGKNVVADAENTSLYATIDGMVVKTDNGKINVFPVYEVNGDVDYSVGNIEFVGTVVIRGNVLSGFKVKADGDIRVLGGVESAELEARGSVHVSAGILGQNKGVVRAGVNVKCSFIQDATVEAGQDIIVTQSVMHSQLRAGQNVLCQGAKGLIVGGTIQAGEKVAARTIGNTMSTPTTVEVGVRPELRNELSNLRGRLKQITDNLDKTEKALAILDQMALAGQLTQDKLAMRVKLINTKKQSLDEQSAIQERIVEIEKMLDDTDKARVEVSSTVYAGTKIVIGRYTRFVKDPVSRVYFRYLDGEIAMLPLL